MKLEQIKEILNKLSASKGDTFSIPVEINKRLTRTLGRVKHMTSNGITTPFLMEFSQQMLDTMVEKDILSVIRHCFKALCDEIQCHGSTCISVERTAQMKSKYTLYCKCCGKVVGEYQRKCKTVTNYEFYKSNCCGSALRLEIN